MNKQTAVQWLIDRFMDGQVDNKMLRTALHLEKEQILEAWDNGDFCIDLPDGSWEQKYKSGEQYYNENYNKRHLPSK